MRCVRLRFGVLALVLLVGGCSPDSDPAPPPAVTVDPSATPEQLLANFRTAYERRNAAAVEALLDASFIMPLQYVATASYPELGPAIERVEALRMHGRLFGGHEVLDPTDQVLPAVREVEFLTFSPVGSWVQAPPGDIYPGTSYAGYGVRMEVYLDRRQGPLLVHGVLRFHVAMRDTVLAGTPTTYCRLRAITDLTVDSGSAVKAEEAISLGRLWGLWR